MGDHLIPFASTATLCLVIYLVWALAHTHTKVERLERKVSLLLRHAGMDVTEIASREALELLQAGKKVAAIKLYRQYTGCGLAEAKSAVEKLRERA